MPWCPLVCQRRIRPGGVDRPGVVYSFVTAHVAVSPGYVGPLPYTVATVELDGGRRGSSGASSRSLGRLAIGDRVVTRSSIMPRWTELHFEPAAAP